MIRLLWVKKMIERKILTENPYEEVWSYLSYFESVHNCEKYLIEHHNIPNKEIRKERAFRLRYYIKQAREYFDASLGVSFLTQPVLLYYGAVCLSEALILAKRGHEDTTKRHGLDDKINKNLSYLNEYKIRITNRGTFSELYRTILSKNNSTFDDIKMSEWSLKELFSMVPEIKDLFEDNFNEKSRILKVNRVFDSDGEYLKINEPLFSSMDDNSINSFFSNIKGLNEFYLTPTKLNDHKFVIFKKPGQKGDIVKKTIMNEEYLISDNKVENGIILNINEISIHFLILYALSMLCRYSSYLWGEGSLELEKGDFFMIKNFLKVSTRKFPNMILNTLMNTEYLFTTELYEPLDLRIDYHEPAIKEIVKDVLKQEEENKKVKGMIKSAKLNQGSYGNGRKIK